MCSQAQTAARQKALHHRRHRLPEVIVSTGVRTRSSPVSAAAAQTPNSPVSAAAVSDGEGNEKVLDDLADQLKKLANYAEEQEQ